jgi:hypothetical protein
MNRAPLLPVGSMWSFTGFARGRGINRRALDAERTIPLLDGRRAEERIHLLRG